MRRESASKLLEEGFGRAEEVVGNPDELDRFLRRLEEKLKEVPLAGEELAMVPVLVELVKNYAMGVYPDIPVGSLIAIVSALAYFLSPVDFIPDVVPVVGYVDDAAVIAACLVLVQSDVNEYLAWRDQREG